MIIVMKRALLSTILIMSVIALSGQYQVGDLAEDFRLKNVDGEMVSMADFPEARGFVIIFTCNHCPYAVAYEDRIIELQNKLRPLGYPIIAIQPNDPEVEPRDSFENMIIRAEEKGFNFPYLLDEGQNVYPRFGATHTPHVYILNREGSNYRVAYIGTIDNNWRDASAVTVNYITDAVEALREGRTPEVTNTRAIGCTIKTR